jgi:hypothetical protein
MLAGDRTVDHVPVAVGVLIVDGCSEAHRFARVQIELVAWVGRRSPDSAFCVDDELEAAGGARESFVAQRRNERFLLPAVQRPAYDRDDVEVADEGVVRAERDRARGVDADELVADDRAQRVDEARVVGGDVRRCGGRARGRAGGTPRA